MAELTLLPIDALVDNPRNPRTEVGDVTELAHSLTEVGLLEPLVVFPHPAEQGKYVLLAGHRRKTAAALAKIEQVPCIVRDELTGDEAEQIVGMIVENVHRENLTPVEEGAAYASLLEFDGWTPTRVAKRVGKSSTHVKKRSKIAALPDAEREKVQAGRVTLADAEVLSEFADDPESYKKLAKALGTYNFTFEAQRLRQRRETAKALAKTEKSIKKAGVRVRDDLPKHWTYNGVLDDDGNLIVAPLSHLLRTIEVTEDGEAVTEEVSFHQVRVIEGQSWSDPTFHNDCPGHFAYRGDQAWTFGCDQPQTQHPECFTEDGDTVSPTPLLSPEEIAAREAEQKAKAEFDESMSAAESSRLAFVDDVLRHRKGASAVPDLLRAGLLSLITQQVNSAGYGNDLDVDQLTAMVGKPKPDDSTDSDLRWAQRVIKDADDLTLARMLLAWASFKGEKHAGISWYVHQRGETLADQHWGSRIAVPWYASLMMLGYEPSDFERAQLRPRRNDVDGGPVDDDDVNPCEDCGCSTPDPECACPSCFCGDAAAEAADAIAEQDAYAAAAESDAAAEAAQAAAVA